MFNQTSTLLRLPIFHHELKIHNTVRKLYWVTELVRCLNNLPPPSPYSNLIKTGNLSSCTRKTLSQFFSYKLSSFSALSILDFRLIIVNIQICAFLPLLHFPIINATSCSMLTHITWRANLWFSTISIDLIYFSLLLIFHCPQCWLSTCTWYPFPPTITSPLLAYYLAFIFPCVFDLIFW